MSNVLYLIIGTAILLFACMITVGVLFSSVGFAFGAGLLVDVPITLGLIGIREGRLFALLMTFGCSMIVVYIAISTYFRIKSGYPMLPFHIAWASLSLIEILLSLRRYMRQRQG